jgi:hypothetical protein
VLIARFGKLSGIEKGNFAARTAFTHSIARRFGDEHAWESAKTSLGLV